MQNLRFLILSGSARNASFNKRLAAVAARIAEESGVQTEALDLRELALPIYDGDLEAASGAPAATHALRSAILASDAVFLSTPEYNGFPTPLFINAFDWLSRLAAEGATPAGLQATAGKPFGIVSASPGPLGGLRSLNYVRQYLQMAFQAIVVPQQYALSRAGDAFDEIGALRDPKSQAAVAGVVHALVRVAGALKGA